jgi:predicted RNA binding protein YcfA (HicA-like mRNA interferase family)
VSRDEKRLTCADLLGRLKKYGIVQARQRGSHIILLKPESPGSRRGPTYPVPCHNPGSEVSPYIVRALLRRFEIDEAAFWDAG